MVIDHDAHALRFLLDAPHDHVGIDVLVDHSEPEQFGETLDRGQWCAQLGRCVWRGLASDSFWATNASCRYGCAGRAGCAHP